LKGQIPIKEDQELRAGDECEKDVRSASSWLSWSQRCCSLISGDLGFRSNQIQPNQVIHHDGRTASWTIPPALQRSPWDDNVRVFCIAYLQFSHRFWCIQLNLSLL